LINIDNAGSAANAGAGNPGNTLGSRNTFAGLSSATAGTVIMGRHDTPYNISTRKMDLFTDGLADNRSLMGAGVASFDGRQPDVIAYISPSMGGFTGAIAYLNLAEAANTAAAKKASAWSMAGMFSMDAFYASLAYEVHNIDALLPAAQTAKESAWKLGLAYTQDAINVNFAYEKTSDNVGGTAIAPLGAAGSNWFGHSAYYLSGKYSFGNDAVKAAYTKLGNLGGTPATGASQFSLGYDHSLSKRTTVYALYTVVKSDTGTNFGLSTIGTGGANTVIGLGNNPSALSFGMKHTF
jgi:predicted porin